jgi:RNA polymerase sigma factor (sigma-70 family)
MTMTDAELLHRFASQQDEDAFRALVDRYTGLVFHTAWRCTSDAELSREVSQSVFTLLAQKAARLDAGQGLAGWLHRTATMAARNARRRETRRLRAMNALQTSLADFAQTPEDALHPALPHLDEALERLAERDREVLLAHYYSGRTYREIAAFRQESEAAVQRRASRALEKLSIFLRRSGVAVPSAVLGAGLSGVLQTSAPAGLVPLNVSSMMGGTKGLAAAALGPVLGRAAILLMAGGLSAVAAYAVAGNLNTAASSQPPMITQRNAGGNASPLGGLKPLAIPRTGPAGTWQALVAQAAAELRAGTDASATARAAWQLSPLIESDLAAALQWTADLPMEDTVRESLAGVILQLRANHDPASAWTAYHNFPVRKGDWSEAFTKCGGMVFLKRWNRTPAACVADLVSEISLKKSAASNASEIIMASESDRNRWLREVAATASDAARREGAVLAMYWANHNRGARSIIFPWRLTLLFNDPEQRILEMGHLMHQVINNAGMEPDFSSNLAMLTGEEAASTRLVLLEAIKRAPDEQRLKLARVLEDPALRRAVQESL